MSVKFSNNGYGTLAASINSTDTSITVDTGQGARFPTLASGDYFYATLIDSSNNLEIIKVTARATDVLTAVRGQDNSTARSYAIGDRIELRVVAAAIVDPSGVSDQANSSTGYFGMPTGTTAQRPGSAAAGYTRYNTTTGSLEFYDGSNWISTNLIPAINSITGDIYAGTASTLTISLTNATDTIDVKYYESGTLLATDSGVTVTSGSATSTVPSAVYGQTVGDTISIQVFNQDGTPSSNSISKTVVALPTGGTITTSGGYRYHTFTSSSSLVVPSGFSATAEYLIVAGGGGGGGQYYGGGGGAGGLLSGSTSLSASTYTITVGAGGASRSTDATGGNGGNSSAFSQTAIGGGGGESYNLGGAASGGSGGGGTGTGGTSYPGGSGTSGQGYAGGSGYSGGAGNPPGTGGGGGGGAGAAGANSTASNPGGNGGNGSNAYSAWASATSTGASGYYAGGGGGGGYDTSAGPAASGGAGGGGRGSDGTSLSATSGAANTGGGGGGADTHGSSSATSGAGGSGIVIVRYQL